jgi:hypothetical protein
MYSKTMDKIDKLWRNFKSKLTNGIGGDEDELRMKYGIRDDQVWESFKRQRSSDDFKVITICFYLVVLFSLQYIY